MLYISSLPGANHREDGVFLPIHISLTGALVIWKQETSEIKIQGTLVRVIIGEDEDCVVGVDAGRLK